MNQFLHIIPLEKFTSPFISRMNLEFPEYHNTFWVILGNQKPNGAPADNVFYINFEKKDSIKDLLKMMKYDKIFIHNLSYLPYRIMFLMNLFISKAKKYWVLWGMDVYDTEESVHSGIKSRILKRVKRTFVQKLRGIIFWVKGDYDIVCKRYSAKALYFMGGYASRKDEALNQSDTEHDEFINIQVGNSGSPRNRHLDAFEKLSAIDNGKLKIYCPLSYAGNTDYIKSVIDSGTLLFGDRFFPLTSYMSFSDYSKYIRSIDIGVFNSDRQMGLGNITLLNSMGKKVYINDYTTPWEYYKEFNIKIFAFNKFDFSGPERLEEFAAPLTEAEKTSNHNGTIKRKMMFNELWRNIYND